MKKTFLIRVLAVLSIMVSLQQPLLVAKQDRDHSSSHKHHCKKKKDKCCKKTKKQLEQIQNTTQLDLVVDSETLTVAQQINSKLPCENVITAANINPNGFVISTPGSWCLGDDVVYTPTGTNPAITIAASNVTLNLNSHMLSLASKPANTLINGIQVNSGFNNITIENGIVLGFSWSGIMVNPTQSTPGNQMVVVRNIVAQQNGLQLFVAGTLVGMGGFVQSKGKDVIVENSSFINNAFTGASFVDTLKLTVLNSHFDDNISSGATATNNSFTAGLLVFGGAAASAADIFIEKSTFNRNFSEGLAFGAELRFTPGTAAGSVKSITIDNCEFNDNNTNIVSDVFTGTGSQARPRAIGLEIFGETVPNINPANTGNIVVRRSQACRNIAIQNPSNIIPRALGAVGFDTFDVESFVFEDCTATDNSATASTQGTSFSTSAGFAINSTIGATVKRCVSIGNQNLLGFGFGFTTGSAIGAGTGSQGTQLVFEDCIAINNLGAPLAPSTVPEFPSTPVGAGFNIKSVNNCIVTNCIAEQNSIGIYISEDIPNLSSNNIFSNNTLNGNLNFGLLDMSTYGAGTFYSAYYSNVAKQNGPAPRGTNYFGLLFFASDICPTGCAPSSKTTPIREWILPGGPCPVNTNCVAGDKLDNLSIFQFP